MQTTPSLESALREKGFSLTGSRQCVFDALQGREAMSMHELIAVCVGINRASVYRTVSLFEKLGIIQRLHSGWKYKIELTGTFHNHHHHATCIRCGTSFVVPEDKAIEKQLHTLAARIGFTLEKHQLELQGYCVHCQAQFKNYSI